MINIIIIILVIILIIESLCFIHFYSTSKQNLQQQQQQEKLNNLYEEQEEINKLSNEKTELLQDIASKKREIEDICNTEKENIAEQIELYKNSTAYAGEQYVQTLEQQYKEIEQKYDIEQKELEKEEEEYKEAIKIYEQKIADLRSILNAAAEAQLREREKEEHIDFYKLSLSQNDLDDINRLNDIKRFLHNPAILNKLIWSTYFQKQSVEMCNRVLGTAEKVCGIYKITNLNTQQCYIGQSVDIARRFQEHIKCGLGIDASPTNKLYSSMQQDGVWNFSFEVLESCNRDQLNEKEAFWIDMFQAYDLGYNSNRGVSK